MEWFDPKNPNISSASTARLNQATLVGEAVDNLSRTDDFAHGEPIKDAAARHDSAAASGPISPNSGGSGDMASRFTGKEFAVGTSVGVGPVLEFYGNFGSRGVVVGFFVLGMLIRALDLCAGAALWNASWASLRCFISSASVV